MNDEKVENQLKSSSLVPSSNDTVNLIMDPARAGRASSVQRQTDTLRRLARSRDVTPMLQTPPNPYVPGIIELWEGREELDFVTVLFLFRTTAPTTMGVW